MATGVVGAIYKLQYFIFLSIKKNQGKGEEHREFCHDQSVATLHDLHLK